MKGDAKYIQICFNLDLSNAFDVSIKIVATEKLVPLHTFSVEVVKAFRFVEAI